MGWRDLWTSPERAPHRAISRERAGFVLAGGQSSRMGRDKARLPFEGSCLIDVIARRVHEAAGNATIIGHPERFADLSHPAIADRLPPGQTESCGPLGGLYTALAATEARHNLIVACDMPDVTAPFLRQLLEEAEKSDADCLVPGTSSCLSPLCAVYHQRCVAAVEAAILGKQFKMHDLLANLRTVFWPVCNPVLVENINTPEQWQAR